MDITERKYFYVDVMCVIIKRDYFLLDYLLIIMYISCNCNS